MPYGLLLALALPGAILGGVPAMAGWVGLLGVIVVAAWAEACSGRDGSPWVLSALRGAGAFAAATRLAWYMVGRSEWSLWYRELAPGENGGCLSVLDWSPLALAIMIVALPLTVQAARETRGRVRVLRLAEAGLVSAGVVVTGGALGVGLLLFVAAAAWALSGQMRWRHVGVGLAICLTLGAGAYVKRDAVWPKLKPSLMPVKAQVTQRVYAWGVTERMIRSHWLTGVGPQQFTQHYGPARPGDALERHQAVARPVSPQCDPLLVLAEVGLPATAVACWLLISAWRARRRPGPERAALRTSLAAMLLLACLSGVVFSPTCAALLLIVVGRLRGEGVASVRLGRMSHGALVGVLCLLGALSLASGPGSLVRRAAPPSDDQNSPEWLLDQAAERRTDQPMESMEAARRALRLFPAKRAALAANRETQPDDERRAAEAHALTAELLAGLHDEQGHDAPARAYLALADQIRAGAEAQRSAPHPRRRRL